MKAGVRGKKGVKVKVEEAEGKLGVESKGKRYKVKVEGRNAEGTGRR